MSVVPHVVVPKTKYMQMVSNLEKLQKNSVETNSVDARTRDDISEDSGDTTVDSGDTTVNNNDSPPGLSTQSVDEMSQTVKKHIRLSQKKQKNANKISKGKWISLHK